MVRHPANGIAMRATPKAMVKAFLVIDVKAGCFFIMEGAAALIFPACLGNFHRPRNQRRQLRARAQFIQPSGGESPYSKPLPSKGGVGVGV